MIGFNKINDITQDLPEKKEFMDAVEKDPCALGRIKLAVELSQVLPLMIMNYVKQTLPPELKELSDKYDNALSEKVKEQVAMEKKKKKPIPAKPKRQNY